MFSNLKLGQDSNHRLTSWSTSRYNCIAWAAGDPLRPWWPQSYNAFWPPTAINDLTLPAFISAFATRGYECCIDGSLDPGLEKIAIYAWPNMEPQHAARQLPDGTWTSKMGSAYWPDIRHDTVDVVSGQAYGTPVCYMQRERRGITIRSVLSRGIVLARIVVWEIGTFTRWVFFGGRMYDD